MKTTNTPAPTAHTAGPWYARSRSVSDNSLIITDAEHNEICVIREREDRHYGPQNDADMANADLIAAAPELAEALLLMLDTEHVLHPDHPRRVHAFAAARSALARARGE